MPGSYLSDTAPLIYLVFQEVSEVSEFMQELAVSSISVFY